MYKVMITSPEGSHTDLLPETLSVREVLEKLVPDYAGHENLLDDTPLREEDLDKPLFFFGKDNAVQLSSFPRVPLPAPADQVPAVPPPAGNPPDKAREIQIVISSLARWIGKKLLDYAPLGLSAFGFAYALLTLVSYRADFRAMCLAMSLLLCISNLLCWFRSREKPGKDNSPGNSPAKAPGAE